SAMRIKSCFDMDIVSEFYFVFRDMGIINFAIWLDRNIFSALYMLQILIKVSGCSPQKPCEGSQSCKAYPLQLKYRAGLTGNNSTMILDLLDGSKLSQRLLLL